MLDRGHFPAVLAIVGLRYRVPDELRLGARMLALAQPGEVLGADRTLQAPLAGQLALPFAMALLVAALVILLLGRELAGVVRPRLAG